MPKISVIIPTITGREDVYQRCVDAYRDTCPGVEIITISNMTACGLAWGAGAEIATGDYIHFTADDLYPLAGWWEPAVAATNAGTLPAARVLQDTPSGPVLECAVPLGGSLFPPNVLVPFLSRQQFDLGGWVVPIHYGTDDWVTFLACKRNIGIVQPPDYAFVHTAEQSGRLHANRHIDVPLLCNYMQREWYLPEAYQSIAEQLDPNYRRLLL